MVNTELKYVLNKLAFDVEFITNLPFSVILR